MDIIGIDAVVPVIAGILIWSLLMLGIEMGNAMSEAFDHRGH